MCEQPLGIEVLRTAVFSAASTPGSTRRGAQCDGKPVLPLVYGRGRCNKMEWVAPPSVATGRPKPALAQGVVARTNSRDTICQAKRSPACDEPATVVRRPYRRQLVESSTTFSGGRWVRVEEAGGLTRPSIEADLRRFAAWRSRREWGGSEGRNTRQGPGAYPPTPFLCKLPTCSARRPAQLLIGPLRAFWLENYPLWENRDDRQTQAPNLLE